MDQTAGSLICRHSPGATVSGSSFYWALRLLPEPRRSAMFHIYAFCREVDDIADGVDSTEVKMARLEQWRGYVETLFGAGEPDPAITSLKPVVECYRLDRADLIAIIDGMETDAHAAVRMEDEAAFDLYLDRVASAVGRLSDRVFGLDGDASDRLAYHLGRALQITNILRDLDEDAARNRLYVPLSLLAAEGIERGTPGQVLEHPKVGVVLETLTTRAQGHFRDAAQVLEVLEKAKTRPVRVMMAVYVRILERLLSRGLANIHIPVKLGKLEKLWLALRYGVL